MYSCGPPHMDVQEWDDLHELTYSNYVRTQDVTLKTCRRRWMIGRNGERGSGISALAARHDDDDDDDDKYIYIYIYIYIVLEYSTPLSVMWSDYIYSKHDIISVRALGTRPTALIYCCFWPQPALSSKGKLETKRPLVSTGPYFCHLCIALDLFVIIRHPCLDPCFVPCLARLIRLTLH